MTKKFAIAIDGVVASGKGTLAKLLAERLGYIHIDSGALYRAITLHILNSGIDAEDSSAVIDILPSITLSFEHNKETGKNEIVLNGKNVERDIRQMSVSEKVSPVAVIPEVRHFVTQIQRDHVEDGIVIDGRDIGTVVLPDADLKIFLTADAEVRAKRRFKELQEKGDPVSYENVLENLQMRDHTDSTRKTSPLKQAEDAILIDSTHMPIPEVVETVYELAKERM